MQIRHATSDDRPFIHSMGERFYATTSYAKLAPYDRATCDVVIDLMLKEGILLVAIDTHDEYNTFVGMVGLIGTPLLFNMSKRVATEVMWYVAPEARGGTLGARLLAEVEPAARRAGFDAVVMGTLANSPPTAAALYERAGYRHSETMYTKEL